MSPMPCDTAEVTFHTSSHTACEFPVRRVAKDYLLGPILFAYLSSPVQPTASPCLPGHRHPVKQLHSVGSSSTGLWSRDKSLKPRLDRSSCVPVASGDPLSADGAPANRFTRLSHSLRPRPPLNINTLRVKHVSTV